MRNRKEITNKRTKTSLNYKLKSHVNNLQSIIETKLKIVIQDFRELTENKVWNNHYN